MRTNPSVAIGGVVLWLVSGCGGDDPANSCTFNLRPGADDQTAIQEALIDATDGDTVCLAAGRYTLTDQLTLDSDGVTIRGTEGTVLDFSGQLTGSNGIEIRGDRCTLENVRVEDTKGDGVRATSVDFITLRGVTMVWTSGAQSTNGGYGLYPVDSTHVLIEDCFVSGASDAGIYVGQSTTILVRNNEATGNVAGIEIENSTDADVYGNHAHGNTGGILVFNLPGLPVKDGKRAHVHDNVIEDNNQMNFAAPGNIVAEVPAGTGMFILASDHNEIDNNEITGNQSTGIAVVSWFVAMRDAEGDADPTYDWYPEANSVHDNTFADNGADPQGTAALIASLVMSETGTDMTWDGAIDTDKPEATGTGSTAGSDTVAPIPGLALRNCFKDNVDARFLNFDIEQFGARFSDDVTPYECDQDPLPEIEPW